MALRSGLRTYGAQHLCSLAKCSVNVKRIVGGWDLIAVAKCDTEDWLCKTRGETVNIANIVNKIQAPTKSSKLGISDLAGSYQYSLAQLCELSEQKSVMTLMSNKEKLHIEAHSGQHHLWIRQLPLSFKKYALTSPEWTIATRKRLMLNVYPFRSHCTARVVGTTLKATMP